MKMMPSENISPRRDPEFVAKCAATRAVMAWIDADPRRALVGCAESMIVGIAINAYRDSLMNADADNHQQ